MRKLIILFVSLGLLIACNNNKDPGKRDDRNTTNRDKDDYRDADDADKSKDDENSKYTNDRDENSNSRSNWSSSDVKKFVNSCVDEAVNGGMQQNKAESYCNCMQQKLEKKYPDVADIKEVDMESSALESMARACLGTDRNSDNSGSSGWSRSEQQEFVTSCVKEAQKSGAEYLDAQSYCDCMQDKLEKLYPDYSDAEKLTSDDLSTPSMKRMMEGCRPGN